jgi:hypothetical protein
MAVDHSLSARPAVAAALKAVMENKHQVRRRCFFSSLFAALVFATPLWSAEVTMTPLLSFGNGDGWLAPDEPNTPTGDPNLYLSSANNERGIAYDAATAHLYLASRGNSSFGVRILNAITGEDVGSLNADPAVINGGTFPLNMVAVGADGAIYAANLTTSITTSPFKVYKWENELAAPSVVFDSLANGPPVQAALRVGDSLDVFGAGLQGRIVAGYGANAAIPESNGYAIIDPNTNIATNVAFTGTEPATGDFQLGITFTDSDSVIGTRGGGPVRLTSFSGGTGTLDATFALASVSERPMDYAVVGGIPLLATVETGASANASTVRVYDMTNPSTPVLSNSAKIALTANANINGSGRVSWGPVTGNTATLYAMNTNNGIQAFTITVPEPSVAAGLIIGAIALFGARRVRQNGMMPG